MYDIPPNNAHSRLGNQGLKFKKKSGRVRVNKYEHKKGKNINKTITNFKFSQCSQWIQL